VAFAERFPASPALLCSLLHAAITTTDICAAANGTWALAACTVSQQPPCGAAGGAWAPRTMWSLEGGMDMLIVGLLQGALSYPFFDPVLTGKQSIEAVQRCPCCSVLRALLAAYFCNTSIGTVPTLR
jgi:hypothetical protein